MHMQLSQPIPSFDNDYHSSSTILFPGHFRNAPNGLILGLCFTAYSQNNETSSLGTSNCCEGECDIRYLFILVSGK